MVQIKNFQSERKISSPYVDVIYVVIIEFILTYIDLMNRIIFYFKNLFQLKNTSNSFSDGLFNILDFRK